MTQGNIENTIDASTQGLKTPLGAPGCPRFENNDQDEEEPEELSIRVYETTQAGDNFLLKWKCPICKNHNFTGYPIKKCDKCKEEFDTPFLLLPKNRSNTLLLVGSTRKKYISKKLIIKILEVQEYKCAYCFFSLKEIKYEIDHIIPLCVGGTNNQWNLCASCRKCNEIAGGRFFTSFASKSNYIRGRRKKERM